MRITRTGRVTISQTRRSTPSTATPTMRNGRSSSQTIGYSTRATSANGQQQTNNKHHNMNPIIVYPPSSVMRYASWPQKVPLKTIELEGSSFFQMAFGYPHLGVGNDAPTNSTQSRDAGRRNRAPTPQATASADTGARNRYESPRRTRRRIVVHALCSIAPTGPSRR